MSELSPQQAGALPRQWTLAQFTLHVLIEMVAMFRRAGSWTKRTASAGTKRAGTAIVRAATAVGSIRLPVSREAHAVVLSQLERFELQAIATARSVECRQKRTRALLALSRTAYEIGRDNQVFLKATLEELQVEHYWHRKQARIFNAAQLACSVAGLAAMSGHAVIARDAYLCGQGYNGKVIGVDRKIGMATAFADVAALLEAHYDRVAWLSTAMELACGIPEQAERTGAVNFVARKMVTDRIPPCDSPTIDKRFAVDTSAMDKLSAPAAIEKAAAAGSDHDEFSLVL